MRRVGKRLRGGWGRDCEEDGEETARGVGKYAGHTLCVYFCIILTSRHYLVFLTVTSSSVSEELLL